MVFMVMDFMMTGYCKSEAGSVSPSGHQWMKMMSFLDLGVLDFLFVMLVCSGLGVRSDELG